MGEELKGHVTRAVKEKHGNGEPGVLYGQAKDFGFYSEMGNVRNVLEKSYINLF